MGWGGGAHSPAASLAATLRPSLRSGARRAGSLAWQKGRAHGSPPPVLSPSCPIFFLSGGGSLPSRALARVVRARARSAAAWRSPLVRSPSVARSRGSLWLAAGPPAGGAFAPPCLSGWCFFRGGYAVFLLILSVIATIFLVLKPCLSGVYPLYKNVLIPVLADFIGLFFRFGRFVSIASRG